MSEKTSTKITADTEITSTELARILGITVRRIQQLAQDGTILTAQRGRFPLGDSVQRYINFLSKNNDPRDKEKIDAEISIKKAKAIVSVLEAKELQGKVHRSEDVAAMTEDLVFTIRGMLLALPGRLAVDVITAKTPSEAAETIRKEVHAVMTELSNYQYDAKKYEERTRERRSWGDTWNEDE